MLQNPLYARYLHLPSWGIPLTKAQHEPIISLETWQRIQDRLEGRASWSKGRRRRYAYYVCQTKDCASYGKSIKRADVEGEFETLLKSMIPRAPLIKAASAIFKHL